MYFLSESQQNWLEKKTLWCQIHRVAMKEEIGKNSSVFSSLRNCFQHPGAILPILRAFNYCRGTVILKTDFVHCLMACDLRFKNLSNLRVPPDSLVMNTRGGQFQLRKTPRMVNEIRHNRQACLLRPG